MSSLLLCQTVLCLVAPPVIPVIAQQNNDRKQTLLPTTRDLLIAAATTNILDHLIAVNPFVRFSQSDMKGNIVVNGNVGYIHKHPLPQKIFGDGTENRFGPLLEFIVQRIQTQFSNYIHEDLSRPYDDPVTQSTSFINIVNKTEQSQVDAVDISSEGSTLIPLTTSDENDEYDGSGGWLTVNE